MFRKGMPRNRRAVTFRLARVCLRGKQLKRSHPANRNSAHRSHPIAPMNSRCVATFYVGSRHMHFSRRSFRPRLLAIQGDSLGAGSASTCTAQWRKAGVEAGVEAGEAVGGTGVAMEDESKVVGEKRAAAGEEVNVLTSTTSRASVEPREGVASRARRVVSSAGRASLDNARIAKSTVAHKVTL